ncbi:hypothetical protein [Mesorhizobium sp. M0244]|uniref:hypothetical protein n=1 Tax=Mesorhizobium sp. M0244 TaxID=2956926 RepID=UPI003338D591
MAANLIAQGKRALKMSMSECKAVLILLGHRGGDPRLGARRADVHQQNGIFLLGAEKSKPSFYLYEFCRISSAPVWK